MFDKPNAKLERYRLQKGPLASSPEDGNNGIFIIPGPNRASLKCIVSDGKGWEHVSVTVFKKNRTPTWEEMCFVKDLFWPPDETVVQYHPPESEYVNNHEYALHLWRPIGQHIPLPPSTLVGIKRVSPQQAPKLAVAWYEGRKRKF